MNVSLGHPIYEAAATDPLVQAVEAAVRAGITVVVAAGNIGISPFTGQVATAASHHPGMRRRRSPSGAVRTLSTTTRQDDLVADFSSRGPTWFDALRQARPRRAGAVRCSARR